MDLATWKILILLQAVGLSLGREFILDSEEILSKCINPPPGAKSAEHMGDFSKFNSKKEKDGMHISGNITMVWDIGANDRIEISFEILKLERGIWKPTPFAGSVKDFCSEMYEKNTLYYPYTTKHITSSPEIKDKCVYPGTVLVLEPFLLKVNLGVAVPLSPGPHRIILKWTAISPAGVPNPNHICFEFVGKLV